MKKIFLLGVLIVVMFSFAYSESAGIGTEESYPDYYYKNIKENVIYKSRDDNMGLRKKILDFDIGLTLTYETLLENDIDDLDEAVGFGVGFKKVFTKYDYIKGNILYRNFDGEVDGIKVKDDVYSLDLLYKRKVSVWDLQVYLGGGISFIYNKPDIPFRDADNSGLGIILELSYDINNISAFVNYSKSSLEPFDFRNLFTIGLSYYFNQF